MSGEMNRDFLYIGGGTPQYMLAWLVCVSAGIANSNNIRRIVVECRNSKVQKRLKEYESQVDCEILFDSVTHFRVVCQPGVIRSLADTFHLFKGCLTVSREELLRNKCWKRTQVQHSVWDLAMRSSKDGCLEPGLWALCKATVRCFLAYSKGVYLQSLGCRVAILGHNVYSHRSLSVGLVIKDRVALFGQARGCVYRRSGRYEVSHLARGKSEWDKLIAKQAVKQQLSYIRSRRTGKSTYKDAATAGRINNTSVSNPHTAPNQVFLHVFRDSPFNIIDNSRIYADYVDWITDTIRIIAESDEEWCIRRHPSSVNWGENQDIWLDSILSKVFSGSLVPDNIRLAEDEQSNVEVLERCKRVVTFSGTVALEASCWGVKPITISTTILSDYREDLVFKPKSRAEYKSLLLMSSNSRLLEQTYEGMKLCEKLLYSAENQISLMNKLDIPTLYRPSEVDLNRAELAIAKKLRFGKVVGDLVNSGRCLGVGETFSTVASDVREEYQN